MFRARSPSVAARPGVAPRARPGRPGQHRRRARLEQLAGFGSARDLACPPGRRQGADRNTAAAGHAERAGIRPGRRAVRVRQRAARSGRSIRTGRPRPGSAAARRARYLSRPPCSTRSSTRRRRSRCARPSSTASRGSQRSKRRLPARRGSRHFASTLCRCADTGLTSEAGSRRSPARRSATCRSTPARPGACRPPAGRAC